jgi:anti-sigma factor RsiW
LELIMNCRHLQDNLEAYVRNELDAEREKQVAAHLKQCTNCRSRHEAIFVIHIALKDLPTHRARADFNMKALERFDQLKSAQDTAHRVDEIARGARNTPGRRLALWLDSLVPRGLGRYRQPAMLGVAMGLVFAALILFSPRAQNTVHDAVRRASELHWLTDKAPWSGATPLATPVASPTPRPQRWDE